VDTAQPCNHLLAALPAEAKERLAPYLERVALPPGRILQVAGDTVRYVHFPVDAVVGVLHELEDGAMQGIFLVGNEGMVGVSSYLGGRSSLNEALVLSPGCAYRILASRFVDEFKSDSAVQRVTLRYILARLSQLALTVACTRHHSIRQQLSRWLLLCMDRRSGNRLDLTQELIAQMLGVRRGGVTDAANELRELRVIDYQRGHITVLDRSRLEGLACECYGVVRRETDRLLSRDAGPQRAMAFRCTALPRSRPHARRVARVPLDPAGVVRAIS